MSSTSRKPDRYCCPLALAVTGGLLICAQGTLAATQGSLGAESTGVINITLELADTVQLSGLSDISLRQRQNEITSGLTTACVYASRDGNLGIHAVGSGDNQNFALSSATDSVNFAVMLADANGQSVLSPGVTVTRSFTNANDPACLINGPNASFTVTVDPDDIHSRGVYSGVLTLMLTTE